MSNVLPFETSSTPVEVVDLSRVTRRELEPLWEWEANLWLEKLCWDISPVISVMRRAVERKTLAGKAVRVGSEVVGYCYYMREGRRAVLGSLVFNPGVETSTIGPHILGSLLASITTDPSVHRIESQFISFGLPWLSELFCSHDFTEYRRAFLRRSLTTLRRESRGSSSLVFEHCRPLGLSDASRLMQEAHRGSVDAEMNELYRTREGCRTLIDNIVHRWGCGKPIDSASFVAFDERRCASGLVIATEISPHHAHLAQVAVSPSMQGQGLGKLFLHRSLSALSREGYQTVSLMVSDSNRRAHALYDALGFEEILCFPVFSWDSASPE